MTPATRRNLETNISYHEDVADSDADPIVRDLHAETARQLRGVLETAPLRPAIDDAMAARTTRAGWSRG